MHPADGRPSMEAGSLSRTARGVNGRTPQPIAALLARAGPACLKPRLKPWAPSARTAPASPPQAADLGAVEGSMNAFLLQYLPIVIFLGIALALGLVFTVLPTIIAPKAPDPEKLSSYECGFNAFDDARMKFDVRFYLVSILFIIFDLEVAFLFPWAVSLLHMPHAAAAYAFWSMMAFLGILTVGFIYEWKRGALEWE